MPGRLPATVTVLGIVIGAGALAACKREPPPAGGGFAAGTEHTAAPSPEVCAGAEREGGALHWFHDDYGKALACAKARGVPLAIDMWAPWCHTCLSMQAYVLTDPKLAEFDRRYVFLALDTDREVNAAPVAKFPPAAWPTFFVVSPHDESIQSRFVGAASVEQFAGFLADGERGHLATAGTAGAALGPADRAARDGDQAASRKDWTAAATAYKAALAAAPAGWIRRPDVLVSLIAAQSRRKDTAGCAEVALAHMNDTGSAASASDFTAHALNCAEAADKQGDAAGKGLATQVREAVAARLATLTEDRAAPLSVDDRSDALMYLRQALAALGRTDAAKAAAEKQAALLDDAARTAPDARIASTYNWPRSEVYLFLGKPLDLVAELERSAAALPEEYDPPYRVAWLYQKAGKLDEAKTWIGKAVALAYGPRKTRALAMLADIEKARGDVEAERAARAEVVATWEKLPAEARSDEAIAKAKAELAAVGAGSGSGSGAGSATGSGK